jgi:RNA polymerase sigma-70 factor (ECF subfamily)
VEVGSPAIDAALHELLVVCRAVWPDVVVDDRAFVRHVAALIPEDADPNQVLGALHGADLYLAFACGNGDARAIALLEKQSFRNLPAAVMRTGIDREKLDEIKQLLRHKLLVGGDSPPKILDYAGRGPLDAWVRVVAAREALTMMRKITREPFDCDDDKLLDFAAAGRDPEIALIKTSYAEDFRAAFQNALSGLTSRDRTVLRLHFVDGLNIDAIGSIYRVHRATVARWIANSREELFDNTHRLMRQKLGLSPSEVESLIGELKSQIDLSIPRFLAESKPEDD